jgi:hypothetical protein
MFSQALNPVGGLCLTVTSLVWQASIPVSQSAIARHHLDKEAHCLRLGDSRNAKTLKEKVKIQGV